jgi:hypothetical protein
VDTNNPVTLVTTAGSLAGTLVTNTAYHAAQIDPSTLALYVTIISGSMTGLLAFIGVCAYVGSLIKKTFFDK